MCIWQIKISNLGRDRHSPSLWVKDPISSQSQKNEGCFLKWFQLSWEGEEVIFHMMDSLLTKSNRVAVTHTHTHLDGSLQVTDKDIGEMQIFEVAPGCRRLLMSRVWQQCVNALTYTVEEKKAFIHTEKHIFSRSFCEGVLGGLWKCKKLKSNNKTISYYRLHYKNN